MNKEKIIKNINYLYSEKKYYNNFLEELNKYPQHCSISLNKGLAVLYFGASDEDLIQMLNLYCTNEIKRIEKEISKYEITVKVVDDENN